MTQAAKQRLILAVGIIVLAVGAVALISIVKQRGETARHADIIKVAEENQKVSGSTDEQSGGVTHQDEQKDVAGADTATGAQGQELHSQEELPQTGSSHILVQAGQVAFVTFLGVAYVRSRRSA